MNKYRKEYCEENGRVKINPENTKLYDYIKHLENKLEQAEQLTLTDVSGSLLSDLDYWKQRCELAEKCIEESPCDPDITSDQIKAHNAYNKFVSNYGNDR